jgi:hypothetical protein
VLKKNCLCTILVMLIVGASFGQLRLTLSEKCDSLFSIKDRASLTVYQTRPNPISTGQINHTISVLKKNGISFSHENIDVNTYNYRNDVKSQYLSIDRDIGLIFFVDNKYNGFTDKDILSVDNLEQTASALLAEIIGPEYEKFTFFNISYEYIADREKKIDKRLYSMTFRYVKIMDGRRILGNDCYASITLGRDMVPCLIKIANPTYISEYKIKSAISMKSIQKYLQRHLQEDLLPKIPVVDGSKVISIKVIQGTESYFPIQVESVRNVVPHVSFFTEIEYVDGQIEGNEVHIPIDAQFVKGVDPKDVIHLSIDK